MYFSFHLAFSGYSANTKYDPHQIKAEIASRRDRVSKTNVLTTTSTACMFMSLNLVHFVDISVSNTHILVEVSISWIFYCISFYFLLFF